MKLSGKLWIEVPAGVPRSLPPGRYKGKLQELSLSEQGASAWLHLKTPSGWQPASLFLLRVNGEWQGFLGKDQFPVQVSVRT